MEMSEKEAIRLVRKVIDTCMLSDEFRQLSDKDKATVLYAAGLTISPRDRKTQDGGDKDAKNVVELRKA